MGGLMLVQSKGDINNQPRHQMCKGVSRKLTDYLFNDDFQLIGCRPQRRVVG